MEDTSDVGRSHFQKSLKHVIACLIDDGAVCVDCAVLLIRNGDGVTLQKRLTVLEEFFGLAATLQHGLTVVEVKRYLSSWLELQAHAS